MNFCNNVEVGARNERRICAVNCNKTAGFEVVHGLLDRIMLLLEVSWNPEKTLTGYYLRPAEGTLNFTIQANLLFKYSTIDAFKMRCV